jgi:hypothetical protein
VDTNIVVSLLATTRPVAVATDLIDRLMKPSFTNTQVLQNPTCAHPQSRRR